MKRKIGFLYKAAVLVLMAVLLTCCFVACNKGDELPDGKPTSWETDLRVAADRIAEHVRLNGGLINITFRGEATVDGGKKFSLFAGMNYNLENVDDSMLCVELADEDRVLASLKSNNSTSYVDVVPNDYIGDAKLQVLNLNIFDLFNVSYNAQKQDGVIDAFSDMLVNLGMTFFNGVNIEQGDVYVFDLNPEFASQGEGYFRAVFDVFGKTVTSAVLGAFGIDDISELFGMIPSMQGKVAFDFGNENGVSVTTRDLVVGEDAVELKAEFAVAYTKDETLADKFPSDSSGYVQTKIGNSYMSGTISLYGGSDRLIKYDYELNANIDLLSLVLNDYDLTKLSEDNYLHFKVSHKCDSKCGSFCTERIGGSKGSVFEIGFSPIDFGTYNIYCSVNVSSILSTQYVEKISEEAGMSLKSVLPEYMLFAFPHEKFYRDSVFMRLFNVLYADNLFNGDDFELVIDNTQRFIGETDGIIGELLEQFLHGDDFNVDKMRFDIKEYRYGQALQYDVYKQTVYIIADDVSEVKDYGQSIPIFGYLYVVPLSWEYESMKTTADGELQLTNIYDWSGNLLHGVDGGGNYVPMSPEEAAGLQEFYLHATYTKYDKVSTEEFAARIVEVSGLDINDRGVQEVTLKVEYPNPLHSGKINEVYELAHDDLCVEVKAKIKLTDYVENGLKFSQNTGDRKFYLATFEKEAPEFLKAQISVRYENGYVKTMDVIGESDAVVFTNSIILARYSIVEAGSIKVKFKAFNQVFVRYYDIERPDEVRFEIDEEDIGPFNVGSTVYMANLTTRVKMYAIYNDMNGERKEVDVLLRAGDFFVNNIPLSNSSSDWQSKPINDYGNYTVDFYKSNNYNCVIKKLGYTSDTFAIRVLPAQIRYPTYKYEQTSPTHSYWFVDSDYSLSGKIINETHGETPDRQSDYSLEIEILKGEITENPVGGGMSHVAFREGKAGVDTVTGKLGFYSDGADRPYAVLNSLSVGDVQSSGNSVGFSIPDMILNPVEVVYSLRINEAGYYRIRLNAKGSLCNSFVLSLDIYAVKL